jgi:ABC-type Fe2+-enterobactin transport system substrate-binding protein
MLGGLLSAIIVGAILEKGDLYAKLASESYIQSADDAEFLKNMSEDEKKKAQAMLSKIKKSNEGTIVDQPDLLVSSAIDDEQTTNTIPTVVPTGRQRQKEVAKASSDLFSDYGD